MKDDKCLLTENELSVLQQCFGDGTAGNVSSVEKDVPTGTTSDSAQAVVPVLAVRKCAKCGKTRRIVTKTEICGTCDHRESRRINSREMWGRGRRGY